MNENVIQQDYKIKLEDRVERNKHKPLLIWFTGLSGSGKSTICNLVEAALFQKGYQTYSLDGDNIRNGINSNLGFSEADRSENIRRVAEISKLLMHSGTVVLAAFISPLKKDRLNVKAITKPYTMLEVFVNTSLEECERRDVKGLYQKARRGEIKNMTGIGAPYEEPVNPDIEIKTEVESIDTIVANILEVVIPKLK